MNEYYLKDDAFIIENYDKQKTFSSFLPGVAGKRGIPIWAFYVNRGQAICSFGLKDKTQPILEFSPANVAYQNVDRIGFRTFVKVDGEVVEFFKGYKNVSRNMEVYRHGVKIIETNEQHKLKVEVNYFGLPNETVSGLVRRVKITNLSNKDRDVEILDGLAQVFPLGVGNADYKAVSNLLRSWMDVANLEDDIAYYKLRASTGDSAEVSEVEKGSFYISLVDGKLTRPIVDANLVFGHDTHMETAVRLLENDIDQIVDAPQITANKVPCGFTPVKKVLKANSVINIETVIGGTYSPDAILSKVDQFCSAGYFDLKEKDASGLLDEILQATETKTNYPIFDQYIKQNHLDNILRGGYPLVIETKNGNVVYHIFSRKHGDLERDYNFFSLADEFYSQGNGNFRDVCQNRRCDSLLHANVKDANIKLFGNLIQLDGYNPLGISGLKFTLDEKINVENLVEILFENKNKKMIELLSSEFTPGSIINLMANENITSKFSDEKIFELVLENATEQIQATFGEGYWIDHFTYILDLIENYNAVYPDKLKDVLFDDKEYKYYFSPATVVSKEEKTVVKENGQVRQFGALIHHDEEKIERCNMNVHGSNWLSDGNDKELKTNLFSKLFVLLVNKYSLLDPNGIGIEMEADKPGWNDAMNGLPGIFGSGVSETIESLRIAEFMYKEALKYVDNSITIPIEFYHFYKELLQVENEDDYKYWQKTTNIRDEFIKNTRFGVSGNVENIMISALIEGLELIMKTFKSAVNKAKSLSDIIPTFLTYDVTKHEDILKDGKQVVGNYGLPTAKPTEFSLNMLPAFLEAPARLLKIEKDKEYLKNLYNNIKNSGIYDEKLKIYKTSDDLDSCSNEIGRARAFTKGWLERESDFLHMIYKYLLGLLKTGLYEEFFNELETNLVCFMDPKVYGRSILENSSFIATSNNPNPDIHGQGFVSRLSGSTVEVLSLWTTMMYGKTPFTQVDGELQLKFSPMLRNDYFDSNDEVSFTFLGHTKVTYVNNTKLNTYDENITVTEIHLDNKVVKCDKLIGTDATDVRNGKYSSVRVVFAK